MMDASEFARRVPIEAIDEVPAEHLPAVALYLAALQVRAAARSAEACTPIAAASSKGSEALLDVREAAARLNLSVDWLYRHAKKLPFTRRGGPRRALRSRWAGPMAGAPHAAPRWI